MPVMAISLASGLYSVHCLIPPHPGAAAAAATLGVDFGRLILAGIIVAVPATLAGFGWAIYAGRLGAVPDPEREDAKEVRAPLPPAFRSFLPVVVPVVLIAVRSFVTLSADGAGFWRKTILTLGDPVIALAVGLALAFLTRSGWTRAEISKLLQDSAEKAGGILVIIGAGGAFGAVLTATKIGEHFSATLPLGSLGILFPFVLTVLLKTAQGSSTVALLTAASIVQPLLPALSLSNDTGRLLCALALGAGSMTFSQANDAYFWVIAKFSGLDMKTMLRVHSVASGLMGLAALAMVYVLKAVL